MRAEYVFEALWWLPQLAAVAYALGVFVMDRMDLREKRRR